MRRDARGVTLVEPVVTLGGLAAPNERACPIVGTALDGLRAHATTDVVYGAVHPTRARACATGLMPALVVEPDTVGIVEDHAGAARIVSGSHRLVDGVASGNRTFRFTPKRGRRPGGDRHHPERRHVPSGDREHPGAGPACRGS